MLQDELLSSIGKAEWRGSGGRKAGQFAVDTTAQVIGLGFGVEKEVGSLDIDLLSKDPCFSG